MNNNKQIPSESQALANALELVLSEIENNGFANLLTLKKAIALWTAWEDNLDYASQLNNENILAEKIQVIKYPQYTSISDINPLAIISALKKNNGSVELLLSLKRQQLIAQEDAVENASTIMKLLRQGFIEEYALSINNVVYRYYTLSSKGLRIFDDREINKKIKSHLSNLSVPVWLKNDNSTDHNYLLQAAIINMFFSRNRMHQYLTFEFGTNPGLVLANVMAEEQASIYYCTLGLDATNDSNNISFIQKILDESTVKKVVIICIDNMIKNRVTEIMKIRAIESNAIEVCSLEDTND